MDSPRRNHVRIGNIIKPAEEPMNLAVHADPVSSTINFHEYQKATEQGAPNRIAVIQVLSDHHSERY